MAKQYPKLGGILKKLLFDRGMKASDLAREVNLPPPTIHRLITGKSSRPYKSSLKPIADYFSLEIDQLLGEQSLASDPTPENQTHIHYIPLIPWNNLNEIRSIIENKTRELPFLGLISDNAFGVVLEDSSMEPIFPKGSTLIFDPEITPKDRSFVLVELNESHTFVFRQMLIDVDQQYLKPLNPDLNNFKMRILSLEDRIRGVLVEARQSYKSI